MATTYHPTAASVRAILIDGGFHQTNQTPMGTQGYMSISHSKWANAEGHKAHVSYVLMSNTGQSSRGSAAVWGYALTKK